MKFSPQLILGLVCVFLGILFIVAGVILKLNQFSNGWITGNNSIIFGMFIELIGIFIASSQLTKNLKK